MQTTMRAYQASGTKPSTSSRSAAIVRPSPCTSRPSSRSTSVKVYAKKGQKGRQGFVPGQQEVQRVEPPTPEVDLENAEFVIFVRATKYLDEKVGITMKASPWAPITVVKAGQAANYLVKAMENEWGRKLYARTLLRNIGQAVYKDREKIERQLKLQATYLKNVPSSNFEYAMKIRDKTVPKDWYKAEDITIFPPENQLQGNALDDLKRFFSPESFGTLFSTDSAPSTPSTPAPPAAPQQQQQP